MSCNERHALSSYGIDFTHSVYASCRTRRGAHTDFAATEDAGLFEWEASRPVIRLNFSARAARFIRSNTPVSVSLGDVWGYADATVLNAGVRNSQVRNALVLDGLAFDGLARNSREPKSGAGLRNATALDTQLTQRSRFRFRRAERTPVENSIPRSSRTRFSSANLRDDAVPAGTVRCCCITDSPSPAVSSRRGTLTH
jgi:hypothetical protein